MLFLNPVLVRSSLSVSIFMPFQVFNNDSGFVAGVWYTERVLIIFGHAFS